MAKRFAALAALAAVILLGAISLKRLPADNTENVTRRYRAWSGVIRVWVAESSGIGGVSPVRWLNSCAETMEKGRPGVKVYVQTVPDDAVRDPEASGFVPPDIVISSIYAAPAKAQAVDCGAEFLRGITAAGAVPLMMNAHMWLCSDDLDALPGDMYTIPCACRESDLPALAALCSGERPSEDAAPTLPGIDLGLDDAYEAEPIPREGSVKCRMGENLTLCEDPLSEFASGSALAVVADISDMQKLRGRVGFFTALTGAWAYSDEILAASVVASDPERLAVCRDLIAILLGEGQSRAFMAGGLGCVRGSRGWPGDSDMTLAEEAADEKAFFTGSVSVEPARLYIEEKISADEAVALMLGH